MVSIEGIGLKKVNNTGSVPFRGHNLSTNDAGEKTYRFFIPKVMYDDASVILKRFALDANGNIDTDIDYKPQIIKIEKGKQFVEISPDEIGLSDGEVLGYRFVIDGNKYNDTRKAVIADDGKYNIADILSADVLKTPKSIYHIVPSSFNPKIKTGYYTNALEKEVLSDDRTARMNHFMKFDTSLKDIIEKIPYIQKMGFRRLLSTPIFGQDNISSHGYWTNNPFQITSRYGTMKDFADLQIALFQNSMGYIADGAFTNEGLTGIHLRDIIRHGAKSPFIHWFELFNYPSMNLKFGILPDGKKAYDSFDIRVVNSPVVWTVDKYGKPTGNFGMPNRTYDPQKETYIQIYDKRLTSQEQLQKDEVFTNYAIRNTKNPDDISNWMDSVSPYAFPVKAADIIKRAKLIRRNSDILPKEYLTKWENFELTNAKDSSGILLWTGTKDIPKLRFVFPDAKKKQVLQNANTKYDGMKEIAEIENSVENVQNYIVDVGKFWTNKTAKILREYIAREISQAKDASDYKRVIISKALAGRLPEEMKYITDVQIKNALDGNYEASYNLQVPATLADALSEYPLEALEVSDDLTTIFAYPEFKANFEKYIMPDMEKIAAQILRRLDSENLPYGKFYKDVRIKRDSMRILQLISDDIKRFLVLKSLNSDIHTEDTVSDNRHSFRDISAMSLGLDNNNPEAAVSKLLSRMKFNLSKISHKDVREMVNYLSIRLSKIKPEAVKVADLIIDKTEAGLNWRIDAAKDISDMEMFFEDETSINEAWGEVADFWGKFNSGVRLYNNHSYKIGEFTDSAATYSELNDRMRNAGDIEDKLIERSGFTSQSNYNYLFELLHRYFTAMPEANGGKKKDAQKLIEEKFLGGWSGTPGYLYSGNKNNIAFSHMAVGNHDKQRISHTFIINSLLAYKNYWSEYDGPSWSAAEKSEIQNDLLNSSMQNSIYYPYIKSGDFGNLFDIVSQKNLAKMAAYTDAFAGALKRAGADDKLLCVYTKAFEKLTSLNYPTQDTFFYKNFEATMEDILGEIQEQNASAAEKIKNLIPLIHSELTRPARKRGTELAKLMVALPGNPTLFAGDELLELGGEEKSKNFSFQNRNRLHFEYLKDSQYAHINRYKDELSRIFNLRNDENLSSLTNGDTVMLKIKEKNYDSNIVGLYRYNDHDDSLILLHNKGFNSSRFFGKEAVIIDKIDITDSDDRRYGLPSGMKLQKGTKFINALNPEQIFSVNSNGDIVNDKGGDIVLTDAVTILKRLK